MEQPLQQPENNEAHERQLLWEETLANLDTVIDKLGHHIDPHIKESVAAFMVNGFPTASSCEGHIKERSKQVKKNKPYVAIEHEVPKERYIGEQEIRQEIAATFGLTDLEFKVNKEAENAFWNYIEQNHIPETPEFIAARAKNNEAEREIISLLALFYSTHQEGEHAKLKTERVNAAGRFRVTTASDDKPLNEAEVADAEQELIAEQEEMRAFTEYLKKRFFGSDAQ